MSFGDQRYLELLRREARLRAEAGAVCAELRRRGEDWQEAWRTHPVAIAYRALLKEAWGDVPRATVPQAGSDN